MQMDPQRRKMALAGAAVVVLLLAIIVAIGVLGTPSIQSMSNEWGEVDDDRVEVLTELEVDNPNPIGLGYAVSSVNYTVYMNDVGLATGGTREVDLPSGVGTLELSTDVRADRIPPWWVSHLRNDEVSDLEIDATIGANLGPISSSPSITHTDTVETDVISTLDAGLASIEGEHRSPPIGIDPITIEPAVEVTDTDAAWGEVTAEQTELQLAFTVHNPNVYPIPTPAFAGNLEFNDVDMGEWTAEEVVLTDPDRDATIPPGETRELTFAVAIDNARIGDWFPTHVDRGEETAVRMAGQLAFVIDGYTITVPPEGSAFTCSFDLKTAILVDRDGGVRNRSCSFAGFSDTPSGSTLEAIGAGVDLDPSDLSALGPPLGPFLHPGKRASG